MSGDQLYQIVFDGTLTGEVETAQVKKNLAVMFKMNATQVEALFSGKPIVIKRNIDNATAKKYGAAFIKAGAKCTIIESSPSAPQSAPAPKQSSEQRVTGRMSGKDIVNKKIPADLGGLSMAEAGADIPTQTIEHEFELPDLSNLSMSVDESYLVKPAEHPEPSVNISGLSMEDIEEK